MNPNATERQLSEIEFSREHSKKYGQRQYEPVDLDVVQNKNRRWWNAYWTSYSFWLRHDLKGKKVLIPGCGFGPDIVRLSHLGARVYGFDISPDLIEKTRERMNLLGIQNVDLRVLPSESTDYDDDFFDYTYFNDILHHVDIPSTIAETKRVMKPDGWIIGNELYTHSFVQKTLRENWLVEKFLYPRLQKYIYGKSDPYITEYEHKISESEFQHVKDVCREIKVEYFDTFACRVFPGRYVTLSKLDRICTKIIGGLGKFTAGRLVFEGRV